MGAQGANSVFCTCRKIGDVSKMLFLLNTLFFREGRKRNDVEGRGVCRGGFCVKMGNFRGKKGKLTLLRKVVKIFVSFFREVNVCVYLRKGKECT